MKILILTSRYPLPEMGGDYLRINKIARYLKQQGHEVVLLSLFHPVESQKIFDESLYDKCYLIRRHRLVSFLYVIAAFLLGYPLQIGYFFSFQFFFKLKQVIRTEKPDRIIPHLLRTTSYLQLLKKYDDVIVEQTDALSKTYNQCANNLTWNSLSLKMILYSIEQHRIAKYERRMINSFPKNVFVSQDDIVFLGNHDNLYCYPNGVDVYPERKDPDLNKIVFIGNMRSLQNEDAALYFANEIFPLILKKAPHAKFYIVGATPSSKLLCLPEKCSSIIVTGFIDDLNAFIADAAVSVAPIRYAAGIQNKTLVSLALHIPVVISPLIANGIPELKDHENSFICSSPEDFADDCLLCMQRTEQVVQIENAGYEIVLHSYSWNSKLLGYEIF